VLTGDLLQPTDYVIPCFFGAGANWKLHPEQGVILNSQLLVFICNVGDKEEELMHYWFNKSSKYIRVMKSSGELCTVDARNVAKLLHL